MIMVKIPQQLIMVAMIIFYGVLQTASICAMEQEKQPGTDTKIFCVHSAPFVVNQGNLVVPQPEVDLFAKHWANLSQSIETFLEESTDLEDEGHNPLLLKIALSFKEELKKHTPFYEKLIQNPQFFMNDEGNATIQKMGPMFSRYMQLFTSGSWKTLNLYILMDDFKFTWGELSSEDSYQKALKGDGLYRGEQYDSLRPFEQTFILSGLHAYYLMNAFTNLLNKGSITTLLNKIASGKYEMESVIHMALNVDTLASRLKSIHIDGTLSYSIFNSNSNSNHNWSDLIEKFMSILLKRETKPQNSEDKPNQTSDDNRKSDDANEEQVQ